MPSRVDLFDQADRPPRTRPEVPRADTPIEPAMVQQSEKPTWPIVGLKLDGLGDNLMPNRFGRPHKGIDLHAPVGTPVVAARSGRLLRVIDGSKSRDIKRRRAGVFIDVLGVDGLVYRTLHLASVPSSLRVGDEIKQGQVIGSVSNLARHPHIHFEIRRSDYNGSDYGPPINPKSVMPQLTT